MAKCQNIIDISYTAQHSTTVSVLSSEADGVKWEDYQVLEDKHSRWSPVEVVTLPRCSSSDHYNERRGLNHRR